MSPPSLPAGVRLALDRTTALLRDLSRLGLRLADAVDSAVRAQSDAPAPMPLGQRPRQTLPSGPPADWLAKVQAGAPHLLEPASPVDAAPPSASVDAVSRSVARQPERRVTTPAPEPTRWGSARDRGASHYAPALPARRISPAGEPAAESLTRSVAADPRQASGEVDRPPHRTPASVPRGAAAPGSEPKPRPAPGEPRLMVAPAAPVQPSALAPATATHPTLPASPSRSMAPVLRPVPPTPRSASGAPHDVDSPRTSRAGSAERPERGDPAPQLSPVATPGPSFLALAPHLVPPVHPRHEGQADGARGLVVAAARPGAEPARPQGTTHPPMVRASVTDGDRWPELTAGGPDGRWPSLSPAAAYAALDPLEEQDAHRRELTRAQFLRSEQERWS